MIGLSGRTSENGSETFGFVKGRKLFVTLILLIVLNGCGTWSSTLKKDID
jgi:hypothetical protein